MISAPPRRPMYNFKWTPFHVGGKSVWIGICSGRDRFGSNRIRIEEVLTLPIGPEESGPMWYARARLAVTTWGCLCWGAGVDKRGIHKIYVSRVMDRTAAFTIALLRDVLDGIDLSACTHINLWSDVGTHFRSYSVPESSAKSSMEASFCPNCSLARRGWICGHLNPSLDSLVWIRWRPCLIRRG